MHTTVSLNDIALGAGAMPQIQAQGVTKSFPGKDGAVVALKDIDLDIHPGEFVCLLGPSGCGKSTLLNAIGGFSLPSHGQLTVAGQTVSRPGPDRGMVFQEYALFPWLTVAKNIAFGLEIQGLSKQSVEERVSSLLDKLHLQDFRNRSPRICRAACASALRSPGCWRWIRRSC